MQIDPVTRRVRPIADFPEQLVKAVDHAFGAGNSSAEQSREQVSDGSTIPRARTR